MEYDIPEYGTDTIEQVCEKDDSEACLVEGECVTSVEVCKCPDGYTGFSCEYCAMGYYER